MELYKFLTPQERKIVKERTEIRNVKITELTYLEIIELSVVLHSTPGDIFTRIWNAC